MNDDSNVNYLNKLPLELWREILSAIPLHPALTTDESTDPLQFLTTTSAVRGVFRRIQTYRLGMMTVCKTLYPLAQEMLHSRIGVRAKFIKNGAFERASMRQIIGSQRRCGEVTTHLWVFDRNYDRVPLSLDTVLPNLRSLKQEDKFHHILPFSTMLEERWSLRITVFAVDYCGFGCDDLIVLSLCLPQLSTLKLLNMRVKSKDSTQIISFPRLQVLVIDFTFCEALPPHILDLPLLKWMRLETKFEEIDFIGELLRNLGRTLQGIELGGWGYGNLYTHLHNSIFGNGPNLETFIFDVAHLQSLEVLSGNSHPLKHLVIKDYLGTEHPPRGQTLLLSLAHNLVSRSVFPSLERITLGFYDFPVNGPLNPAAKDMVLAVKELLPNILVEGVGFNLYSTD
ncbi:hypothetical protein FRC17_003896 [Serendipita sp. 399]|nr:hypothetical protein FRC17_003896 [Serendipita sp. 399]